MKNSHLLCALLVSLSFNLRGAAAQSWPYRATDMRTRLTITREYIGTLQKEINPNDAEDRELAKILHNSLGEIAGHLDAGCPRNVSPSTLGLMGLALSPELRM